MKLLVYVIILFNSSALLSDEVKVSSKKNMDTVSESEKLKNVKRYYQKEYESYYRGHYRYSQPHPLMTGLVMSFIPSVLQSDDCIPFEYMHNKKSYKEMKACDTPRVEYPVDINIFSDRGLKKKIGVIHFGFDESAKKLKKEKATDTVRNGSLKTTSGMSFTDYRDFVTGHVEINGKRSCKYAPKGKDRYNVKLGDDCEVFNHFPPWFEVNVVHKNSYEIKQKDGSSIFLSKKEMKPYVYKTAKSDRDYLIDNKILTEKQLEQASEIFKKVKNDLYKMKEDRFIKTYYGENAFSNYKQYYSKQISLLKKRLKNFSLLKDFKYAKSWSLKNKLEFQHHYSPESDKKEVSIIFSYKNDEIRYHQIRFR